MNKFDIRVFMTSVYREAGEAQNPALGCKALFQLLTRKKEDFIRQAYWQILNRDVDPDGLAAFTPRAGSMHGRVVIVLALMLSPERILLPAWLRRCVRVAGKVFQNKKGKE